MVKINSQNISRGYSRSRASFFKDEDVSEFVKAAQSSVQDDKPFPTLGEGIIPVYGDVDDGSGLDGVRSSDSSDEFMDSLFEEEGYEEKPRKKLSRKFVVFLVLLSLVMVSVGGVYLWRNFYKPPQVTPHALSPGYQVSQYGKKVAEGDLTKGNFKYLSQEFDYKKQMKLGREFTNAVLGTVHYTLPQVEQKDIHGDTYLKDDKPVMVDSDLLDDDTVQLTYVDWSALPLSDAVVKDAITSYGLSLDDPELSSKLPDVFAQYVVTLAKRGKLPTKTVKWKPSLERYVTKDLDEDGKDDADAQQGYRVSAEEDKALDTLLFGSKALLKKLSDFSTFAFGEKAHTSKEWTAYVGDDLDVDSQLVAASQKDAVATTGEVSQPASDSHGVQFNSKKQTANALYSSVSSQEVYPSTVPQGYWLEPLPGSSLVMPMSWTGVYRLQELVPAAYRQKNLPAYSTPAPVGDGSRNDPAGLGVSVPTVFMAGGDQTKPLRVTVRDVKAGQDAIDFLVSKDTNRNRGITTLSNTQYVVAVTLVENLSPDEITVKSNIALSDSQGNVTSSAGKFFGLTDEVKIPPFGQAYVESWVSSPNLQEKYLIYGKDFERKHEPVWLRQLAASSGSVKAEQVGSSASPSVSAKKSAK